MSWDGQAEESMALSPWREEWVGRDGGAPEGNPTQVRARLPDLEGAWDVDFPGLSLS